MSQSPFFDNSVKFHRRPFLVATKIRIIAVAPKLFSDYFHSCRMFVFFHRYLVVDTLMAATEFCYILQFQQLLRHESKQDFRVEVFPSVASSAKDDHKGTFYASEASPSVEVVVSIV